MPNTKPIENEKLVTLSVDIPYILKDQLKFNAYKENRSIKDIVRTALEEYLKHHNKI